MSVQAIQAALDKHLGVDWRLNYTDQQAADTMNTPSVAVVGAVSINDLLGWAGSVDAFAKLEAVASLADDATLPDGSPDPRLAVRGAAGAALRLFGTLSTLNLTRADVISMMDGLVAAGVFTQSEKDSLWALGTKTVTPCEAEGIKALEWDDVKRAR